MLRIENKIELRKIIKNDICINITNDKWYYYGKFKRKICLNVIKR